MAYRETTEWDQPPVAGQRTSGYIVSTEDGTQRRSRFEGTYVGIRPSEWTGQPVHLIADGSVNGVRQSLFGWPAKS